MCLKAFNSLCIVERCLYLQVVKAGFNSDYGLMTSTSEGLAYPQPAASKLSQGHDLLEFLGLMLAKALYEGILLDWPLAPFFVSKYDPSSSTLFAAF